MNAVNQTHQPTVPAFAEWRSELAPFVVVRTAGLSVNLVRRTFASRLAGPAATARAAGAVLEEHRQRLEDGCHAWVAALEQDRFRHRVLDVRRAIHNSRLPAGVDDSFLQRMSEFDASLRGCFETWRSAMQQRVGALAALETIAEDLRSEHFARSLLPLFDDPVFALGLSHSAPTIFRDRAKNASGPLKPSRRSSFIYSMLSYLTRAGTKTSPLTTFMQWAVMPLDPTQPLNDCRLHELKLDVVSGLNRSSFAALRQALAAKAGQNVALRVCPTLQIHEPDQIAFWAASYTRRDDRMWRRDLFTRLRLANDLIVLLRRWLEVCPGTVAAACDELEATGVPSARAKATVDTLIRKGVLLTGPEPDPFAELLAPPLVEWAATIDDASLLAAANGLAEAERDARRFSAADLADRLQIGHTLPLAVGAAAQTAGFSSVLNSAWLVLENSSWSGVSGHMGKPFFDTAQTLMAVIKRKLLVSQQYIWLRDFFVQQYGSDGVCRDPLAFFAAVAQAFPAGRDWRDRHATPQSCDLDLSGWKIPLCFHFQLDSATALTGAVPVLNAVYSRGIWVLGRYTTGSEGAELARHSRTWLARCAAPAEPVSVVFGAEASNLQVHGALTDRFVDCGGTQSQPGRILLRDLVFRHDSKSGLLKCEDQDGRELRPIYLGGSQPGPHFGAAHFLILMGEPVVTQPPPTRMLFNESSQAETVRHQPRHIEGGCVLMRATWWIRTRVVMAALSEAPFAESVLWLHDFFEREGIPQEGFVFGQTLDQWRAVDSEVEGFRKPMWYDLNDAWCVKRLLTICDQMDYLVIREGLPTLESGAIHVKGAPHVAEFHVEAWIEAGAEQS
jgi:hypothetical protein